VLAWIIVPWTSQAMERFPRLKRENLRIVIVIVVLVPVLWQR